jgi:signal peptidase II
VTWRLLRLVLVSGTIVALDLWTKHWATQTLAYREPVEILGPFLRFTYTRNSGVAFGLGAGLPFPYYLFSVLAVLVILYLFFKQRVSGPAREMALALIMGGAIGNLVDRLRTGDVVDFIEIGYGRWHWPVFNVADSAVTAGVVLFALTWPRRGEHPPRSETLHPDVPRSETVHEHSDPVGPGGGQGGEAGPLPRRGADGPIA